MLLQAKIRYIFTNVDEIPRNNIVLLCLEIQDKIRIRFLISYQNKLVSYQD